ncbi:MAG: translocation/assembly module TamB domain-containing protein [Deltaproteobacteria bacterium]|nr:translocation/assembly module TamB domain-containing protein [Deltaproteobacteria bacterium]
MDILCRATMLERRLYIEQFKAQAPFTTISLSGTVDWMKDIMDVRVQADPLNIAPFIQGAEIAYQDLGSIQLTAEGSFHQPEITVSAAIGKLQIRRGDVKQVSLSAQGIPVKGFTGLERAKVSMLAEKLTVPQIPRLRGPLRLDFSVKSPDFTVWEVEELHLTAKDTDVRIDDGRINPVDGHFRANIRTLMDRLQPLMPTAMSDMDAKLKSHIQATGNYHTMRIDADLDAVLSDLTGLPPAVAMAIGPELTLNARAGLMDGTLNIRDARVEGRDGSLKLGGSVNTRTGGIDAQYQLDMNALKPLTGITGQQLAGSLRSRGSVTGTMTDFTAEIALDSKHLQVNGLTTQDLHARIMAKGLPQKPSGSLNLQATVLDQSATLSTGFRWSGDTLSLSRAQAKLPGIHLNADFDITPGDGRVRGTAQGNIESLELIRAVSGVDARGMGTFRVKAHAGSDDAGATLDAHFTDLKYATYGISDLTINTRINDLNKLQGRVDISAKDIALKAIRLDTLTLGVKGNPKNARVDLETRGSTSGSGLKDATGAPIALSTHLHVQHEDMWQFRLDRLNAAYKDLTVVLPSPATVTMDNNRFTLDHLALDTTTGRLQAKGEFNEEKIDFSARIDHIPLAFLEPLIHRDLSGTATVNLDLSGALVDPAVQVKVHVRDYRIPGAENLESMVLEVKMDAKQQEKRFLINGALFGLGDAPFAITASIPAHLSLKPLGFHLDETADVKAGLKGHLDLTILKALPGMGDQDVKGLVDVDLGVVGPISHWALTGGVTLSQGRYENVSLGMILDKIQGRLNADDQTLRLTQLTATDGAKGTIALEGDVHIAPPYPINARLSLKEATLIRKEILMSTTSGKMDLGGNKDQLNLTGEITLDRTELTIPRRLPRDVVDIPVEEINLPEGMAIEVSQASDGILKFLLMDLMLKIPARFFVRGHGLDAEFKGQINVKGPAHKPVVRGTLSVVRGTYQFLARTFHITEGQIAFDGSTPPTPFLNVTAEVKAGEIDAQVRITGPTNDFKLSLTSQPPLPQDEIMANILFGQSAAKLNPFQAYQLASALAQLSGHDTPDVMGKTRKLLGLDRLTLSGGSDGDDDGPAVEVGKYVSERVYVGMEQDITDAKQDVVVEVDITPNFSVESKAGTKSGAGLGFSWKFDY